MLKLERSFKFKTKRNNKEGERKGRVKAGPERKECKEDLHAIREGIPQGGREGHEELLRAT